MIKLLLITIAVYALPQKLGSPPGIWFFVFSTTWSLAFVAWLTTQKTHVATALIAVELFSMLLNFIGRMCYTSSLKSIYIYEHRPDIITACFIAELVIILGVHLRYAGADGFIHALRFHFHNAGSAINRCAHSIYPSARNL